MSHRLCGFVGIVSLSICLLLSSQADAEVHGACQHCGRLVVIQDWGAGLNRDWQGHCGRCALVEMFDHFAKEEENPAETLDRMKGLAFVFGSTRYVQMKDGTAIDMRHFVTAASLNSLVVAELGGRIKELKQVADGAIGGRPFSMNEDTISNREGGYFGAWVFDPDSGESLGNQVVNYLESKHGEITGTSDVDALHWDNFSKPHPPKK